MDTCLPPIRERYCEQPEVRFPIWIAGGDVKGGETVGETDEFSLRSIKEPVPIRHVHTTILNRRGLNDEELRFLHAGRMRQLTDIGAQ
mgnify:CR=1 FL=1